MPSASSVSNVTDCPGEHTSFDRHVASSIVYERSESGEGVPTVSCSDRHVVASPDRQGCTDLLCLLYEYEYLGSHEETKRLLLSYY
jgi:hypothetical protein